MFTPTYLVLGLLVAVAPLIAAQETTTSPPSTTTATTTTTAAPSTTPKAGANIEEGIDFLISKVAASYKSVNNGYINLPDTKVLASHSVKNGTFGDLSGLQRVSLDEYTVRESPEQENPKTVSFEVTLPKAEIKYDDVRLLLGFFKPSHQLSCTVGKIVYYGELSIQYANSGCVANLSNFKIDQQGQATCAFSGGMLPIINNFASHFSNVWNNKKFWHKNRVVSAVTDNIKQQIQSHLLTDFDCQKYKPTS